MSWAAKGAVRGLYWLPALDVEPDLRDLAPGAWREGLRRRVNLLHAALRTLGDRLGAPATFVLAATSLGGRHGYGERPATAPMGGAVAGLVKAFHRERPGALVKVADFEAGSDPAKQSDQLIEETLFDGASVEVGRCDGARWSVGLEERPAGRSALAIGRESVFLVTGAAGSIVSAIVADLAAASAGTFHLLDLTPEPSPDDPDIVRFERDREGLKLELADRMRAAGERPTPGQVERRLAAIERSHAALAAIAAVRRAGGECFYHAVDITDGIAVAAVVDDIRRRHGRIDVLLHAAGVEVSHLLPEKDAKEFARVFGVKADGWFNVLKAAADLPIGAIFAFSSVAGRFGNAGQTDYSAANDLLCKSVSNLRATRTNTHAVAIDWTAWANIGMATRGSVPRLMELAGIETLPPGVGVATVRRELAGAESAEVVVAGKLGSLLDEVDPAVGTDPGSAGWRARAPLIGQVMAMKADGELCAESTFDPRQQLFLDHHRIDGTPVLPGVMGVELLAEVAALPLPDHRVVAIENVEFAAPFKFYRDEPRKLRIEARFAPDGDGVVARCALVGSRTLAGLGEPQVTRHFAADVRMAAVQATGELTVPPAAPSGPTLAASDIRNVYFHGPAFQVLETAWTDESRVIGRMASNLPPLHVPASPLLLTDPRLIELCFQTVGVLELGTTGRLALPAKVSRVVFHESGAGVAPFCAVVTRPSAAQGYDADVVDSEGRVLIQVRGYATIELPLAIEESWLEPFRSAIRPRP